MQALDRCNRIGLPGASIACQDYELLHPRNCKTYASAYEQIVHHPIRTPTELVEAFYASCKRSEYAGFKSMPVRDQIWDVLGNRSDITFITLTRNDIPSTIASFMLAIEKGTWKRVGGKSHYQWRFTPDKRPQILSTLLYLKQSLRALKGVPNAIRLRYEDLCQPGYTSKELDAYFGSPIEIEHPLSPTSAETYVENWQEFKKFVHSAWERAEARSAV
ncbi:MAG: hypothetical protein AB4050_14220 [Synechococcus sp.]